jgi:hypothetical protein
MIRAGRPYSSPAGKRGRLLSLQKRGRSSSGRCAVRRLGWALLLLVTAGAGAAEPQGLRPWDEYRVIMWIGGQPYEDPQKVPLFFQRLREMGIDTGMVYSDGDPGPLLENAMPYYVENIVNKGLCLKRNSPVADWNKLVDKWVKTRDRALLIRPYGLDDPDWRAWATNQMQSVAKKNRANAPLAYDIRDELSTTVLTNPFDYDFSPTTLAAFRRWLQTQYADLAALNRQWETTFGAWDEVVPFTTDEIKHRMVSGVARPRGVPEWRALERVRFDAASARRSPARWNFSPWADFRTYMDVSLASALDEIRLASHSVDPQTPVGIEGVQMPSAFGGYDLWRLSQVVDWVEPYDVGSAREIFASFIPDKPLLSTIGEDDTRRAIRQLWHTLLQGDRGCVVWWSEDCIDWTRDDLALTAKAKALAPALREMSGALPRLFLRARRIHDPIALHYSQPSIQVDWLLQSAPLGENWVRWVTSEEEKSNRMARVRKSWLKALQDLGYSPRFVSAAQIEEGALRSGDWRVLVLPRSLAMSDRELAEVRRFVQGGQGVVLADTQVAFDAHGRLRQTEPLEPAALTILPIEDYAAARLDTVIPSDWKRLAEHCRGVRLPILLAAAPAARTQIHRYRLGAATLVAFERNVDYDLSDDIVAARGNVNPEKPIELQARLATPAHVYELRQGAYLGFTDAVLFTLDPWRPSLYALLPEPVSGETVTEFLLRQSR